MGESLTVVGEGIPYGCWWGNPLRLGIPYGVGGESLTEEFRKLDTDTPLPTIMLLIWRPIESLIMKKIGQLI